MDHTESHTITVGSLCTGYGGLDIGISQAFRRLGFAVRTAFAVEIEAFACANLVAKMEAGYLDAAPIWTDLKTFKAERFRGVVDIVTGGYPCQPFSAAGKRLGTDDPRHLWPYVRRVVEAARPLWCFFENVEGHLSLGYDQVYKDLRRLGYAVEAGLFSAAEVGAPHRRNRLFILAKRTGVVSNAREVRCHTGRTEQSLRRIGEDGTVGNTIDDGRASCEIAGSPQQSKAEGRLQESSRRGEGVPDALTAGLQGLQQPRTHGSNERPPQPTTELSTLWPAPYGAEQYPWEPPRIVVGNAEQPRTDAHPERRRPRHSACESGVGQADASHQCINGSGVAGTRRRTQLADESTRQAQPPLGRDADGLADWMVRSTSRTDELRLLGNGVVPDQAERALCNLLELFGLESLQALKS